MYSCIYSCSRYREHDNFSVVEHCTHTLRNTDIAIDTFTITEAITEFLTGRNLGNKEYRLQTL